MLFPESLKCFLNVSLDSLDVPIIIFIMIIILILILVIVIVTYNTPILGVVKKYKNNII